MSSHEIGIHGFILFLAGALGAVCANKHSPWIVKLSILVMYAGGLATTLLSFLPFWE